VLAVHPVHPVQVVRRVLPEPADRLAVAVRLAIQEHLVVVVLPEHLALDFQQ
jgi:hypothetical protein